MTGWRWARWTAPLVAIVGCARGEAGEPVALQTVTVERGSLRITAEATGSVEPIRTVEVKSKASGEILALHVDVGDEVETGTLLAEVDPRDVRNAYEQAVADLQVAEDRARIAQAQLARQQQLHEAGVITAQEFESATLEASNARATLVKARTNLELAELRLGDVTIRAPVPGTILQKNVEEGSVIQSASQNVSGGTVLFLMASLDAMQVRTMVDETDMGSLRAGMPANVTVEAYPDRVFRGEIEKVEPQGVDLQNVTMFPVIVSLENRGGFLRPGMNAEVEILIDEATDVLTIPNNALVMPQDVAPAAAALGLDPDQIDLTQFRRRGRFAGAPQPDGAPGGAPEDEVGDDSTRGDDAGGAGGGASDLAGIRARVARGEISRDSARALFRAAGGPRGSGGTPGSAAGMGSPAGGPPRQFRNAVVFVLEEGVPSPVLVQIGLNDWDRTQVVSGLEEGDVLALIGAARLQQQQQEMRDRFRSFGGGGPLGGRGR